jgi:hypothetical protein
MKKNLVYLLLPHLSFGILAPAFVLLHSDASEETIALITTEKELEILIVGAQSQPRYLMKTIGIIGKLIPEENIFERFTDCKSFVISKQAKITA